MSSNVEGGFALLSGIKTAEVSVADLALDLDPGDGLRDGCFPKTLKTLDLLSVSRDFQELIDWVVEQCL